MAEIERRREKRPEHMRVLFVPWSRNPYQQALADALAEDGVRVLKGAEIPVLRALFPMLQNLVRYGRPSVLHVHWPDLYMRASNPALAWLKGVRLLFEAAVFRMLGVPVVWTIHNLQGHEAECPDIQLRFLRRFAHGCRRFFTLNQYARETAVDRFGIDPSSVAVTPHGHFEGIYKNTITRREARAKLGIDQNALVFLLFGGLRKYKGVPELVNAFEQANEPDSLLLVVGDPGNRKAGDHIRRMVNDAESIRLVVEFVPDDAVQIYFNAADVMVLPYRRITSSGALSLGMSFSKAIIAPRMASFPEFVSDEGGILYDPDDPDGLRRAIAEMGKRRGEAASMGTHNRRRILQYSWSESARQTLAVYQSCFADRSK